MGNNANRDQQKEVTKKSSFFLQKKKKKETAKNEKPKNETLGKVNSHEMTKIPVYDGFNLRRIKGHMRKNTRQW